MAETGECVKFFCTATGGETVARVMAGPSYATMAYAGTIVMPTFIFERLLDSALQGAAGKAPFQVFFGPEESDADE